MISIMADDYAGKCKEAGAIHTGFRTTLRLRDPAGLAVSSTKVLLSLKAERRIINIDISSGNSCVLAECPLELSYLHFNTDRTLLYMTMKSAIGVYNLSDADPQVTILEGYQVSNSDGMSTNMEVDGPSDLVLLDDRTLLVADKKNYRSIKLCHSSLKN